MSAICREGHLSDEPDYCSVCGAPILSGSAGGTPIPVPKSALLKDPPLTADPAMRRPAASSPGLASCPSCGEPREDPDGRFCEVCRYDFQERRPGPPPVAKAGAAPARPTAVLTPAPAAPAPTSAIPPTFQPAPQPFAMGETPKPPSPAAPTPATAATARSWELVITVDPSLDTEPDPDHPCPADRPEIVMPVDKPDMLVGRHDETRAIHPEISLHDPGASRRHAKFVIEPDGAVALQDLASTNGTQVNGSDVSPGTKRRLREGDQVTLGRWTRITLRGKA